MKYRLGYEAVITIQRARLPPSGLYATSSSASSAPPAPNPYVHLGVMVPKGSEDVTVPTNCATRVLRRSHDPVWNQTFCLPVRPNSDILVLQVFDQRASNLAARLNPGPRDPQRPSLFARQSDASEPDDETSSASSVPTISGKEDSEKIPSGDLIGVSLLPVARIPPDGTISRHAIDIFPGPAEPSVGRLYIATKMEKKCIPMLTKEDISDPEIIGQFHSTRLLAAESRFLGIGELAAFLFEEGYSTSPTENWDRAVVMLAQQLAFRVYQIRSSDKEDTDQYLQSLKDDENFEKAKTRILKEGGLWDGL